MTIVTNLELPVCDLTSPELTGEIYHERLARLRERAWGGWLAGSPVSDHATAPGMRWEPSRDQG